MSRKPNHWTIDQDPEWKIGESSVTRLGEFENGSAYAPKQKDFERREPPIISNRFVYFTEHAHFLFDNMETRP